MEARTQDLIADGFPLLPSNDQPHWTVVLSEPNPAQFARVRRHFSEPLRNPVWVRLGGDRPWLARVGGRWA